LLLPDVATRPQPSSDADLPVANGPDGEQTPHGATSPPGDYVREIQMEYDEQQEEGRL
jgi:hypothetical protein